MGLPCFVAQTERGDNHRAWSTDDTWCLEQMIRFIRGLSKSYVKSQIERSDNISPTYIVI